MATKLPQLKLSLACTGFINHQTAAQLSENTLSQYRCTFRKLHLFFPKDPPISSLTRAELVGFFAWLRNGYACQSGGIAPSGKTKLSAKSILNVHTDLSALWRWAKTEGYVNENIVHAIVRPRVSEPVITPLSRDDFEKLLKACDMSRVWENRNRVIAHLPMANRNRALILLLLDTGMRATELCNIQYKAIDFVRQSILIGGKGPGIDDKQRLVRIGKRTKEALWKHLLPRLDSMQEDDYVFLSNPNIDQQMDRRDLYRVLGRIAERAGVPDVYPHKFRHTFAINYLRNGGDVFTLQELLGHESLEMVQRYARIAQMDIEKAHQKASPVDNWRL